MKSIGEIIKDIEAWLPVDDEWEPLDELIDEACSTADRKVVRPLLGVLERNQEHDGYGVFWSIVHGLEGIPGYETDLAISVLSKPHEMSVLMLNRMLNGGVKAINGKSVLEILEEIASNDAFPDTIRESANGFLVYQRENM